MAYLFAQIIVVFDYVYDPDKMSSESSFWSLMWVVFAIGTGLSYFAMGWISTHVSYVSPSPNPPTRTGSSYCTCPVF